ncbi:MAG TPA: L-threonylcarbamoyladenylate synthase [Dehalococcoidia bacterium]|nr:L-threonylcarbamoyladenylate synthase [Dehalococcoidia bacterium]
MTAPPLDLEKAASLLRDGGVIALPTDTLYALVARIDDASAVRRIYAIKGRQEGKPLPVFVSSTAMAERIAVFNPMAHRLAERFWPGGLTLVLPKRAGFASLALAGGETVAVRWPDDDVCCAVIAALDEPVSATSANRSGEQDPVTAEEVRRQLGDDVDLVIDTGPAPVGVGSTIVDCSGETPVILRRGAVSEADILAALRA